MLLALAFSSAKCELPARPDGGFFYFESFSEPDWPNRWITSRQYNYTGEWRVEPASGWKIANDRLAFTKTDLAYHALSSKFEKPLDSTGKTLVLQYEMRLQERLECGGAYIKLFGNEFEPETLSNETNFVVMFGPDKCGSVKHVQFIFRHTHPVTGVTELKVMRDPPRMETSTFMNHLYTLIVRPDNSFEILVDGVSVKQGSLLEDFEPSVNPPKEIDDPTDSKPDDWVDEEMMDDPDVHKPDDWDETQPEFISDPDRQTPPEGWLVDEPKLVPDPSAKKPEDWDEDIYGEWEPPTMPNPKCEKARGCGEYEAPAIRNKLFKGKWRAPRITNPAYKGPWRPRQIPNPVYAEDEHPHNFPPFTGAGFELWTVNKNVGFTNIYIGNDEAAVHRWNRDHFIPKHREQVEEAKKNEGNQPNRRRNRRPDRTILMLVGELVNEGVEAWLDWYDLDPMPAITFTAAVIVMPIMTTFLMCWYCCRTKKSKKTKQPIGAKKTDKTEEPKTEHKKDDEAVQRKPKKQADIDK